MAAQSSASTGGETVRRPADEARASSAASRLRRSFNGSARRSSPASSKQVVGDEDHRHLVEEPLAQDLSPDAALHLREGQRPAADPGQQLTVEHRAFGQQPARFFDLGEASR